MNPTTLVVEDHPINRRLLRDLLEWRGHDVVEAVGVDDAWDALVARAPDLVLLDIQIPGGGGDHLLTRMRADPRMMGLPVVAVTAQSMPGDRERLLARGFDAYVSKPIDTRAFIQLVDGLVGRS
ncbi:MAG: response regulator [Pseudomonadota bacterium]|nr:response regulator [Pseudomonadota bacterium]